jgi:hypothetical protein
MRIRCIGKPNVQFAGYIIGKIYTVIEVHIYHTQVSEFRIYDEKGFSPPLFQAQYFEIIDGKIPICWVAYPGHMRPSEGFILCPQKWARLDFWDAYFDGVSWAEKLYEQEVAIMRAEDPRPT